MSDLKTCPTCGSEYPMSERFCPRDGTALRSSNPGGDIVGTVVADRYHVIKKLGEGGMGTVYLAEHVKMGRKSALKVMNPGMAQDADSIARFNREASNASRLNHPNICAIYDFGETSDGLIYLAMEFIEGESLTSIIHRSGSLPPARAAAILHQAADALGVAHDYGIVHRDLKPDNIMIAKNRDGSDLVKVVDFGIAKASSSDAQKVTKTGLVVGTPEYMSPEQLSGDKLDGRSDIYSLALVGFNMLTGKLPFPSNSAQEAMIMRLTEPPRQLGEMKPDVAWSADLQAVFDKALAREVDGRYQKAADFGRELTQAVQRMPSTVMAEAGTMVIGAGAAGKGAAPGASTAQVPKTRAASVDRSSSAEPRVSAPAARKHTGLMIGAGSGVATAIVVAVLWVTGVIGPKNGAATPNNSVTQPTDTSQQNVATPPPDTSAGRGGGGGGGGQPRGGVVPNPGGAGGSGGGGNRGGGNSAPAIAWEDSLKRIDDLSDLDAANGEDLDEAILMSTLLLPVAQGDDKAALFFRRATAQFYQDKDVLGCADLGQARLFATRPGLVGAIAEMRSSRSCR